MLKLCFIKRLGGVLFTYASLLWIGSPCLRPFYKVVRKIDARSIRIGAFGKRALLLVVPLWRGCREATGEGEQDEKVLTFLGCGNITFLNSIANAFL